MRRDAWAMAGEESGAAAQLRLLDELLSTLRGTPGAVAAALPPRRGARAAAHEGAESGVAADRRRRMSSSSSTSTSISTSTSSTNNNTSCSNNDDAVASEESEDVSGGRRAALGVRQRRQCVLVGPEGLSPDPSIPASPASSALSPSLSVSSPAVSRPGSPASSASPPGLGFRARRQGVLELGAGGSSSPVGAGGAAGSPGGLRLAGLDARGEGSDPFEAIRSGSLLQLRMWLAARCAAQRSHHGRRRAAVNLVDRDSGRALLHEACLHGREDCVRELLSYQGACDRNKPTLLGRCSPLHLAAGAGHNNVVRVLCKAGVDIAARNMLGETPLHVAANAVVAKTLIFAGADPFSRTKSGASPSQTAAMSDRADVYDALQAEVVRLRKCLFAALVRVGGVDKWTRPQLTDRPNYHPWGRRARKEGGAAQAAGAPPDQGGRGRRSPRRARAGAGEAQGQGRLRRVARRKEEARTPAARARRAPLSSIDE